MSTPNIEELINNLTIKAGVMEMGEKIAWGSDTALMRQAAATLQSQAERIAELERESETHAKAYGLAIVERDNLRHELKVAQEGWRCECSTDDACRFARERDALRAELDAAEPVAWSRKEDDGNIYDCISRVDHDGRHPFNVPLFTRHMPAQDVTELVFVADMLPQRFEHSTCYGGPWTSDWVVAFDANGGATVTRLVISNSTKKLMDADKNYRPLWLAQGNPVVAWMYKTSVKEALSKCKGAK